MFFSVIADNVSK